MMPKVKANTTPKIESVIQDFPKKFMKNSNKELHCNLCNRTVSCNLLLIVKATSSKSNTKTSFFPRPLVNKNQDHNFALAKKQRYIMHS